MFENPPTPFRGYTACERYLDINNTMTSWRLSPPYPPTGAKFFVPGLRAGEGGGAHFAFLGDVPSETPKSRRKFGF